MLKSCSLIFIIQYTSQFVKFGCWFRSNSQTHPLVARAEAESGTVSVAVVSPLVPKEES